MAVEIWQGQCNFDSLTFLQCKNLTSGGTVVPMCKNLTSGKFIPSMFRKRTIGKMEVEEEEVELCQTHQRRSTGRLGNEIRDLVLDWEINLARKQAPITRDSSCKKHHLTTIKEWPPLPDDWIFFFFC